VVDIFADSSGQDGHAVELIQTADASQLVDAMVAAIGAGWLFSIGVGRDGYALSVGVIADGKVQRVWCDDQASLERALDRVLTAAKGEGGTGEPASNNKRVRRRKGSDA
jgi:hypothetical protein